ncbi:hypothetical protein MMC29_002443 [Sticta canariensis]|nr:hypothetical protein [Sticta canariensis]
MGPFTSFSIGHSAPAPPPYRHVGNLPVPLYWAPSNTENFGYSASSSSASVPAVVHIPLAPPPPRRVGNLPGPLDWACSNTENFGYSASSSSTSVHSAARTPPAPSPRRRVGNRPGPLDSAHSDKKNLIPPASSSSASVPADTTDANTTGAASLALNLPAAAPSASTSVITPEYGPPLEPLFGLSTTEATRFFDEEVADPLPLVFPPFLASPRLKPVVRRPSPEEIGFFDRELPVPELLASDATSAAADPIVPSPAANATTVDSLPLAVPPYYFSVGSVALAPAAPASFVSAPFAPA